MITGARTCSSTYSSRSCMEEILLQPSRGHPGLHPNVATRSTRQHYTETLQATDEPATPDTSKYPT